MTAANAHGILIDRATVEVNWNAVQGLSAFNIRKGFEDKMTLFNIRALAVILEPARWLTQWFFRRASPMMRAAKQQAASWEGTSTYATPSTCPFRFCSIAVGWRQFRHFAWL